jgi:hypothetical protein
MQAGGLDICHCAGSFDYAVTENGALAYCSESRESTLLAEPPSERFVAALQWHDHLGDRLYGGV